MDTDNSLLIENQAMRGIPYRLPGAWEDAVTRWCEHLTAAGMSKQTIRARRGQVRAAARRTQTRHPREVTGRQLVAMSARHRWSNDHRRAMRTSLHEFFAWAGDHQLADHNPADALPKVAESNPNPRPAPDHVWQRVLDNAEPREKVMALLACKAGLRRAEIARVHRDDLIGGPGRWSLVVRGKGAKTRIIPITDELADAISSYRADGVTDGFLFPGQDGGHLSPAYVGLLLSRLMGPGWSAHKLRHRFASLGYAGTHDLLAVQAALGHASPATTQRYVLTPEDRVRAVADAAA